MNLLAFRIGRKKNLLAATALLLIAVVAAALISAKNSTGRAALGHLLYTAKILNSSPDYKRFSFQVDGLPGYSEGTGFYRLSAAVTQIIRSELKILQRQTAGGRVRFETNAKSIQITGLLTTTDNVGPNTDINTKGIDVYQNGMLVTSLWANAFGVLDATIDLPSGSTGSSSSVSNDTKHIEIWLPSFGTVEALDVRVPTECDAWPIQKEEALVVFYGSSITQGCCPTNPGMAYPSIFARNLHVDIVNLGFNGNGYGDAEIGSFIGKLKADAVVLDFWANPSPTEYKLALPHFIDQIREHSSEVQIIVMSSFHSPRFLATQLKKDTISREEVIRRHERGDYHVNYAEDLFMLPDSQGLVDGRHLNSLGMNIVAERLSDFFRANNILGSRWDDREVN